MKNLCKIAGKNWVLKSAIHTDIPKVATKLINKPEPSAPTIPTQEPRGWASFVNNMKTLKDLILHDTLPEHSVYLHVPMAQPLILKCSKDEANTLLTGTSNLRYCAFVAAKFVQNDNVLLGYMHYDGTEAATEQLKSLTCFFAEAAGQKKDQVVVEKEQNIVAMSSMVVQPTVQKNMMRVDSKVYDAFKENGMNISSSGIGQSSLYHRFYVDSKSIKIEPRQNISTRLPNYFTGTSVCEATEDGRLKPEIKEHRREFWKAFSRADNFSEKMSVVEKYSPTFLKEREIAEAVGNAQKERSGPSR